MTAPRGAPADAATGAWQAPAEELERFAELRRTGSPELRDQIITAYLPLATHLARHVVSAASPQMREDLVQVAAVGLIKAVDGFRPDMGNRFSTYAVPTIAGELKRHLRDQGWTAHAPRRLQERYLLVRDAKEVLAQRLQRDPTPAELARSTGLSEAEIADATKLGGGSQSLSIDTPEGEDKSLAAALSRVDEHLERSDDLVSVAVAMRALQPRQRRALILHYVHDRSQVEIGRDLGISQVHAGRLLHQSLTRIRTAVRTTSTAGSPGSSRPGPVDSTAGSPGS